MLKTLKTKAVNINVVKNYDIIVVEGHFLRLVKDFSLIQFTRMCETSL